MAILAVRVLTGSMILLGIMGELPATNITAIVSPSALPIPSTIPASTPDLAAFSCTLKIYWNLDAPSANAPSLYSLGTARKLTSVIRITVGKIIIERIIITANKLLPAPRPPKNLFKSGTITTAPQNP